MEQLSHSDKFKPGVYQGTPDLISNSKTNNVGAPRLLRTMKTDMAEAIKNQNETLVSIKISEEKKRSASLAQARETSSTDTVTLPSAPRPIGRIIVILVILIIVSIAVLAYVFVLPKLGGIKLPKFTIPSYSVTPSQPNKQTNQQAVKPLFPSLIPSQNEHRINITKVTPDEVSNEISAEINQGSASGAIKNIYLEEATGATSAEISANRFLTFTGNTIPETLSRSLEKKFMVGLFGETSGKATPFIILEVSDHNTALAGTLEWEQNLPSFFKTVFGTKISGSTKVKFLDIIISGKDSRALDSPFINTIIYAFADKNTIVISGTRTALEALLPIAESK